jgi:signal transduction histidine kinase
VTVELDPGEGELTVLADPAQIHQVLMNLGMNAGQSMHEGGGTLRIAVRPASVPPGVNPPATGLVPGPYAAVSVADTGPGMDSQTLGRIFEPFFSTRAPGAGSGLGLSVVHSIVRSHRGGISVESQPGSGSTFTIFLPSAEAKPGTAGISSGYN